mgnify:CR=1 FL=1
MNFKVIVVHAAGNKDTVRIESMCLQLKAVVDRSK